MKMKSMLRQVEIFSTRKLCQQIYSSGANRMALILMKMSTMKKRMRKTSMKWTFSTNRMRLECRFLQSHQLVQQKQLFIGALYSTRINKSNRSRQNKWKRSNLQNQHSDSPFKISNKVWPIWFLITSMTTCLLCKTL
jgi:hypothetical protein